MKIYAAPLQGYTDSAWRAAHRCVYGDGVEAYFAPFVRVEHGEVRRRDLVDTSPTTAYTLVPQVIFRDVAEFDIAVQALVNQGYTRVDLNLGCPFPPQVKHGRGAGALVNPPLLAVVAERMRSLPQVRFSVKMRLGVDDARQWRASAEALAAMPLEFVTIHPRISRQGYKGELLLDELAEAIKILPHPIVFNGEVAEIQDIDRAMAIEGISGVMIGRGLLRRPSLVAEWREGREWTPAERLKKMCELHQIVFESRSERLLGGDSQVLQSMRTFWDYADGEIDRRQLKAIRKANSLQRYFEAVNQLARL
ncbi:MAG: tRNA-dihydrouridine synthase family protein [Muribaculaceae bacterium]